MKTSSNIATGCPRTLLAIAALLLAAQPAGAGVLLFTMPPVVTFAAPGASEALEVRLMRTRPAAVMTKGFSFDLTTTDPAMSFNGVTASTLGMYVYNRDSGFEPGIATNFTPNVLARNLAFAESSTLAVRATVGLGRSTYPIAPDAALGDVFGIRVAPPGVGAWLWDGVGESIPITAGELRDGANADGLGPLAMVPAGLLMIGLGVLRRRKTRVGERRRKVPGVRKTPVYEARAPGQAKPDRRYVAI